MSTGRVALDTGVLLAAADAEDAWHDQARLVVEVRTAAQLVLPTTGRSAAQSKDLLAEGGFGVDSADR